MAGKQILILSKDAALDQTIRNALPPACQATTYTTLKALTKTRPLATLILLDVSLLNAPTLTERGLQELTRYPLVAYLPSWKDIERLNAHLPNIKLLGILHPPLNPTHCEALLNRAFNQVAQAPRRQRLKQDLEEANSLLNRRLQALNTLYTVGKFIVSSLNVDEVLSRVLDVSVNLTQAEEGFVLLREGDTLYLRAAKNLKSDLVERLHQEANDEIAWRVIRSGRPVMLQRETRIATGYLARAVLYVPLQAGNADQVGVLAILNRTRDKGFDEEQLFTLSSVADFAAITLKNAQLFNTIEAEQSRLRTILSEAAESILITDVTDHLLLWSQTAAEVLEIPEDAKGHPVSEVINHPDVLNLFEETQTTAEPVHAEITLDDGERIFNAQLTQIRRLGRVMVMQDITHLKELDRLKSEFVSTVSHDLRTPLTTIQGYIALLKNVGPLNAQQEEFIAKALNSLDYITDLISDLLDIGRIEAGYNLEMKRLRFDRLLQDACHEMASQAEDADLTLHCPHPTTPLWVQGNANRLRQVIENLISNAVKYNQPNGWIRVSHERDNGHVIVNIQDNGIGIPEEHQAHIFDRFYRVQAPETEDIQGTGLGLAIVKSVIEKHHGRVWVNSKPDKGSTFSFILPLEDPPSRD